MQDIDGNSDLTPVIFQDNFKDKKFRTPNSCWQANLFSSWTSGGRVKLEVFPLMAQPGDSRGLQTAANHHLVTTERRFVARGKALGSVPISHRGLRPQVLARYRTSVSTSREKTTMCNGGKYRSKVGCPAWLPHPVTVCYIRYKLILIKYLTAELPLVSVEMKWFAVCSKRRLQSWHLRPLQENGCCQQQEGKK